MENIVALPVPDCACAIISWLLRIGRKARYWMAKGRSKLVIAIAQPSLCHWRFLVEEMDVPIVVVG